MTVLEVLGEYAEVVFQRHADTRLVRKAVLAHDDLLSRCEKNVRGETVARDNGASANREAFVRLNAGHVFDRGVSRYGRVLKNGIAVADIHAAARSAGGIIFNCAVQEMGCFIVENSSSVSAQDCLIVVEQGLQFVVLANGCVARDSHALKYNGAFFAVNAASVLGRITLDGSASHVYSALFNVDATAVVFFGIIGFVGAFLVKYGGVVADLRVINSQRLAIGVQPYAAAMISL